MIRNKRSFIAKPALNSRFQPNTISAIDEGHRKAQCLGSKLYIVTSNSATRAAASFDHRSPFSAVAAVGSPSTPLGAMSFVSHAKFAAEPSGFSNSGASTRAM